MSQREQDNVLFGQIEPVRKYRVITAYQSSNSNPFSVKAGEIFQVSERVDTWNGNPEWIWVWCTDSYGKNGWVPKTLIEPDEDGTIGIARYTYTARELTVEVGDKLIVNQQESGWYWCTKSDEESGWVPQENLAASP